MNFKMPFYFKGKYQEGIGNCNGICSFQFWMKIKFLLFIGHLFRKKVFITNYKINPKIMKGWNKKYHGKPVKIIILDFYKTKKSDSCKLTQRFKWKMEIK